MYYQNKNYQKRPYNSANYSSRKPIKSFQDLEVYQITAGLAAVIVKRVAVDHKVIANQKPADLAGLGDFTEIGNSALPDNVQYSNQDDSVKSGVVDNQNIMDVGGVEPPKPSLARQVSRPSTPMMDGLYHDWSVLTKSAVDRIIEKLLAYVLDIPVQLTVAHSRRFGHGRQCLDHLEKAMLECNLAVVYLEQYRDIVNAAIEHDFFEDCVKKYLAVRGKILRLQRSWQKFIELNREEKS